MTTGRIAFDKTEVYCPEDRTLEERQRDAVLYKLTEAAAAIWAISEGKPMGALLMPNDPYSEPLTLEPGKTYRWTAVEVEPLASEQ